MVTTSLAPAMHKTSPNRWHAWWLALLCVAWLSVFSPQAHAEVIRKTSTEQLERIMRAEGYNVRRDSDGDIVWTSEGLRWLIFVNNNGAAIQARFSVGDTKAPLEKINEWNRTKRFSKSYLDKDNDPVLELDLDLSGGVERERVLDFLRTAEISRSTWIREVFGQR